MSTPRDEKPPQQLWLTSWAVNNKTPIFLLAAFITLFGLVAYQSLPKEQFPEVTFPTILVTTPYPGASPADIENLISKPIEEEINTISGVKDIRSNSIQDLSTVVVEFEVSENPDEVKQLVKDAVDRAKSELPSDLDNEPRIRKVEIQDQPIMYINLAGDFGDRRLKGIAENIQDRIERLQAINRVDIIGARQREIQVNVDLYRLHSSSLSISDIQRAIQQENATISGGLVDMNELEYALRVTGEFEAVKELRELVVRSPRGGTSVYLKDIAEVRDGFEDRDSYARLNGEKGVTLNVIKRGGENLIRTADDVHAILEEMQENELPAGLELDVIGDTSDRTQAELNNLVNTIIIGFLLVTVVLMFFMGVNNALFVGLAVPLSAFVTFSIIPAFGFTMNIVVLFALLLALGILVDNAIVVVENIYRIFDGGRRSIGYAAKYGAAEVFLPVLAGILTTLAPFFPLLFWPGITGEFMKFLPITLIITLSASMFVAFIINPVFAASFMKAETPGKPRSLTMYWRSLGGIALVASLFYLGGNTALGNFSVFLALLMSLTRFGIEPVIRWFQRKLLPALDNAYERLIRWAVAPGRPGWMIAGTAGLLVLSGGAFMSSQPNVVFFPEAEPNFTYVYLDLPVGTDIHVTDSVTKELEERVFAITEKHPQVVDAVVTNVARAAGDPRPTSFENQGSRSEKGKLTVAYVSYKDRNGVSTAGIMEDIRAAVDGIPGASVTVKPEQNGPPTGPPINVEVRGEDYDKLVRTAERLNSFIDSLNIPGIEELTDDLERNKPEVIVDINRERANRLGINTSTVGQALRAAINGVEASKFRTENDQFPITVRLQEEYRKNLDALMNLNITFRDRTVGALKQIPLSAVAELKYQNAYGGIKRLNNERVVTLSSNVLEGYNANAINKEIRQNLNAFEHDDAITIELTGEQENQKQTQDFLSTAMLISLMLILFILTTLFNSLAKTFLILLQVLFSVIGVLLGFALFQMEISVVMTGVGIVSLAGVVVNNGILLIDFTDRLRKEGVPTREAVIQGGKVRLRPVLLTAASTVLGLVPLAVGFNIDFPGLFAELAPGVYFGGDSTAFWGPLSWTIIFGLSFATVLTLIVLPAMYLVYFRTRAGWMRFRNKLRYPRGGPGIEEKP